MDTYCQHRDDTGVSERMRDRVSAPVHDAGVSPADLSTATSFNPQLGGSEIYRNFTRQLEHWRLRYAGRPDLEMLRLCLLALEREQNVVVTYDENVLGRRLAAMQLPDEIRDLFRHALARVWREEEMHTLYIRGGLLKFRKPVLSARTLMQQAAGAIGGWTVAVRQHVPWSRAPLSRSVASLLLWAGALSGRVPPEIRRRLRYSSFRDFCRYNMDAEQTAWLCWERLAELAPAVPALSAGQVDNFHRVAREEERHRQVFAILAASLTDHDELRCDQTYGHLSARIGAVGECYLPDFEDEASSSLGSRTAASSGLSTDLRW